MTDGEADRHADGAHRTTGSPPEGTDRGGPARPPRPGRTAVRRPGLPGAVPAEPGVVGDAPGTGPDGPGESFDDDLFVDDAYDDDGYDDDGYDDGRDHDYVDLPPDGSVPKWLAVLVVLAILATLVVGGAWWWYRQQVNPPGSPGEVVTVEIPSGSSTSGIASILEDEGVISNSMVFNFYAGRKDAGGFRAGVYEFRENSDFDLVLETLAEGPSAPVTPKVTKVPVPEGLTVDGVVEKVAEEVPRFEADELRAALTEGHVESSLRPADQSSYEGLLFPATYEIDDDTTEAELLGQLADEMETRLDRLDVEGAKARIAERWGLELSTYQLLTVASMVQAEAGNAEEAPKIATVIYNRLADRMPLGIDAVDRYGARIAGTEVDYEDESLPYNTRRKAGLPPTPISAPGEYALEAALQPADGPWLYYVLVEPGVHTFVTTNAEFLQAKQVCRERGLGCG